MTLAELIKKKNLVGLTSEDCSRCEWCSSPICPLDAVSIENGIWYPSEEFAQIENLAL